MEGLHHDTMLEGNENKKGQDAEVESLPQNSHENPDESKTDYSTFPVNKELSIEAKIDLFRQMVRIRRFEERSLRAYQQGHIGGFLHLYIGQEAVAVGSVSCLSDDDHIITAYRDHGHALAVGMGMDECMAELFGKRTGCSKGKGGSMHFFAPDKNFSVSYTHLTLPTKA